MQSKIVKVKMVVPIALWVILAGLLMAAGCHGIAVCLPSQQPNIHIAYGRLSKDPRWSWVTDARYCLEDARRGVFLTNDLILVRYYDNTQPRAGLPEKAILILQHDYYEAGRIVIPPDVPATNRDLFIRLYESLGGDGYRGILPDTAENRRRIAALSSLTLQENSRCHRISKRKAVSLAKQEGQRRGYKWGGEATAVWTQRYNYGWIVTMWFGQGESRAFQQDVSITVGDDGQVKSFSRGL